MALNDFEGDKEKIQRALKRIRDVILELDDLQSIELLTVDFDSGDLSIASDYAGNIRSHLEDLLDEIKEEEESDAQEEIDDEDFLDELDDEDLEEEEFEDSLEDDNHAT